MKARGVRSVDFHHTRGCLSLEDSECCLPYSSSYLSLYDTVQTDPFRLCWQSFPPCIFHFSPPLSVLNPTDTHCVYHLFPLSCSLSLLSPQRVLVLQWCLPTQNCLLGSTDDMQTQNNGPCPEKTRKLDKMHQIQKGACSEKANPVIRPPSFTVTPAVVSRNMNLKDSYTWGQPLAPSRCVEHTYEADVPALWSPWVNHRQRRGEQSRQLLVVSWMVRG